MIRGTAYRACSGSVNRSEGACTNCGSYIAPGTRFCAGCGAPAIDPEMTRLAGAPVQHGLKRHGEEPGEIERTVFTARPTMIFIKIGYVAAALSAIFLTILLALLPFVTVPWYISLPLACHFGSYPGLLPPQAPPHHYTLTDSRSGFDERLIARTTRNIPLRKIQD